MGKYDFEQELSNSDDDNVFQDEIQAISMACMPHSNSISSDEDDDDDDDDLELVRRIKEQYGIGVDTARPLSLKPLISLPPDSFSDDDDDDFETLRAIQRRFSHYGATTTGGGRDGGGVVADKLESKNDGCVDEPLSNDFVERNNDEPLNHVCEAPETSSFPMSAQTFVEAVKKNRSFQRFLRSKMLHIEARMEEIKEVQKRVKTLRDFQVQCKKKISRALSQKQDARVQLISAQKHRANDKGCEKGVSAIGPLENSHVAVYKSALKVFPLSFHREKWSKDETRLLQKEIIKQFQERLFQKSADFLSAFEEPGGAKGVDSMISSITNLDITPDIIQEFSGKVDWNQLASRLPRRTGAECEARWLNYENCMINRKKWTSDEEKHLLFLIQKNGLHNWSYIAEKLETSRTPFQCLAHYQRSLNASIMKRDWTEDEDAQLRSAVEAFGDSNWQAVASVIEGRTGTQCSNRWNKTLLPAREKVGKWSIDEDKRLRVAVTLLGYKGWHRLAQFIPGRTQVQCRERWVNVLDPSLNLGQWTEEEDMKLKVAIAEHGYCWSKVAACVPSRTDNLCRRRWKSLFPDEVPLLKAAKGIKKAALVANFVDREAERPALGVNDFVPLPITDSTNVLGNEIVSHPHKKSRKRRKANSTREFVSSCELQGVGSRKRKRNNRSTVDDSNCDEAWNDNGCDSIEDKMRNSSKSSSKKKKRSGNCNVSIEQKKSWNMPIRNRSRTQRAGGNKVPLVSDCHVSQATGIHDTAMKTTTLVHSPNQNIDLEVLHVEPTSMPQLRRNEEIVEASNIPSMISKKGPAKKRPRSSVAENFFGVDNYALMELRTSRDGNETYFVDAAGTSKQNKKSKLKTDQSEEWQDLPLAALFKEAVNRRRERISSVKPPIRFTYARRNRKGTLASSL